MSHVGALTNYSPADDSGLPHVGLTQILGELPTVLDMKYPVLFRGFLDWLAIFKFDVFKMLKFDCLATATLHDKFLITMFVPVAIVALLQMYKVHKKRKLNRLRHLLGNQMVISLSAQLDSDMCVFITTSHTLCNSPLTDRVAELEQYLPRCSSYTQC